jgi:peptide deformylase
MSVKVKIRQYGDPLLRAVAKPVPAELFGLFAPLPQIIGLMLRTARETQALGIAAQQIGVDYALFAVDMGAEQGYFAGRYWLFANARVTSPEISPSVAMNEGCLSFPGEHTLIDRPELCIVSASVSQDAGLRWEHDTKMELTGWPSRIVQHEYDHTQGKLMVDYVTPAYARTLRRRFKAVAV